MGGRWGEDKEMGWFCLRLDLAFLQTQTLAKFLYPAVLTGP